MAFVLMTQGWVIAKTEEGHVRKKSIQWRDPRIGNSWAKFHGMDNHYFLVGQLGYDHRLWFPMDPKFFFFMDNPTALLSTDRGWKITSRLALGSGTTHTTFDITMQQ
jgi:hypothetical protein